MKYIKILPLKNDLIDNFIENYVLSKEFYADVHTPVHFLFINNYIENILSYINIFKRFEIPHNIFFSCKSNKSIVFIKYAAKLGCGIEVSSLYELFDALKYTNRIIASGPAKSTDYLKTAIANNVIISVDDIEELKTLESINESVMVLLRISNLLGSISRFGINIQQIDECLNIIKKSKIELLGVSFHFNNYNLDNRISAINEILDIISEKKISIRYIDIGGGFPIQYCSEDSYQQLRRYNDPEMYFNKVYIDNFYPYYSEIVGAEALKYILSKVIDKLKGIQIIIEPGRSLLNNCGITIFEIEYLKKLYNGENIIITNGNINNLSEQWFNTDYLIEPKLIKANNSKKVFNPIYASIAGNLCLEQDMLTWRKIRFDYLPEKGDFLIYFNTAGYQMDSNESTFHKIPLASKKAVLYSDNHFVVGEESKI